MVVHVSCLYLEYGIHSVGPCPCNGITLLHSMASLNSYGNGACLCRSDSWP